MRRVVAEVFPVGSESVGSGGGKRDRNTENSPNRSILSMQNGSPSRVHEKEPSHSRFQKAVVAGALFEENLRTTNVMDISSTLQPIIRHQSRF